MVTLADSVGRITAYREAERRLFEVLGGWVSDTPEPQVQLLLARHSHHHAERAGLWDRHLALDGAPSPAPGGDGLAPLGGEWMSFLDDLAAAPPGGQGGSDPTTERLAAVYRGMLPALLSAYRRHLDEADPVCDEPVARTLRAVIAEAARDLDEGEALLGAMPGPPGGRATVDRWARQVTRLAAHLGADRHRAGRARSDAPDKGH